MFVGIGFDHYFLMAELVLCSFGDVGIEFEIRASRQIFPWSRF
jgi:hypothetical protein